MSGVFVIAEAGVNHNGSLDMALKLVEAAKECGADAVKFQTFKAESLVCKATEKAEYQKRLSGSDENQFEMLRRLEISESDHEQIIAHCHKVGIEFLSSPFDHASLSLLINRFGLTRLKLGSGEITNAPFSQTPSSLLTLTYCFLYFFIINLQKIKRTRYLSALSGEI